MNIKLIFTCMLIATFQCVYTMNEEAQQQEIERQQAEMRKKKMQIADTENAVFQCLSEKTSKHGHRVSLQNICFACQHQAICAYIMAHNPTEQEIIEFRSTMLPEATENAYKRKNSPHCR